MFDLDGTFASFYSDLRYSLMFTQLEPNIPVEVVGKGKGYAFAVIDYGQEHHLMWIIAMDETGEIWCVTNPDVRVQNNWTMGRNVKK